MDLRVIKGNVVYGDRTYATNEIVGGVDQSTADYLLMLKVAETVERAPAEDKPKTTPKPPQEPNTTPADSPVAAPKQKKSTGPKTSLD